MKKVSSDTSIGLGVFEVDEKVFFFKRSRGKDTFIVDYSVDGYQFDTFSTNATITKNKKLMATFICPFCDEVWVTSINSIVTGETKSCGCPQSKMNTST